MFSLLRYDAAESIGEDNKLMVRDRDVIHGSRLRQDNAGNSLNINLSLEAMKKLPKITASPDAIHKDTVTGNLLFSSNHTDTHFYVAVFTPGKGIVSPTMSSFFLKSKDSLQNDSRFVLLWNK